MTNNPSDGNTAAGTPTENRLVVSITVKDSITRKGYALLIGVEDYSVYDPTGGKNLLAGRNDVLAYWKLCRRLGYPIENIHMYTSPMITLEDIVHAELEVGPETRPGLFQNRTLEETEAQLRAQIEKEWPSITVKEATAKNLTEAFTWLAKSMPINSAGAGKDDKANVPFEQGVLPGFLAYSGHGAKVRDDLALCPSDVRQGLDNALTFAEIRAIFDGADAVKGGFSPTDKLTVVLDCCFAASSQWDGPTRVSSLSEPGNGAPSAKVEIGSRVFCASGRDEQAYQALLGGHWHGAFTWALTVALEQWKMTQSWALKRSTISHTELLFRARMLLEALSFRQHPILVDPLGSLPVFDNDDAGGHETNAIPDADRLGGQIDPSGKLYTLIDLTSTQGVLRARVILVSQNTGQYTAGNEYWYVVKASYSTDAGEALRLIRRATDQLSDADRTALSNMTAVASISESTTWNAIAQYDKPDLRGTYADASGNTVSVGLTMNFWVDTKTGKFTGDIKWYKSDSSNLFTGLDDTSLTLWMGNTNGPKITSCASNQVSQAE